MNKYFLSLISMVPLLGCSPEISARYDAGKSVQDNNSVIRQCVRQAEEKYPVDVRFYQTNPSYSPIEVSCSTYGEKTTCSASGGYEGPRTQMYDANKNYAKNEFESCMVDNGMPHTSIKGCDSAHKGELCYRLLANGGFQREDGPHSGYYYSGILGAPYKRIYLGFGDDIGVLGGVSVEYEIQVK